MGQRAGTQGRAARHRSGRRQLQSPQRPRGLSRPCPDRGPPRATRRVTVAVPSTPQSQAPRPVRNDERIRHVSASARLRAAAGSTPRATNVAFVTTAAASQRRWPRWSKCWHGPVSVSPRPVGTRGPGRPFAPHIPHGPRDPRGGAGPRTYPVQQLELPRVGLFLHLLLRFPFLLALRFSSARLGGGRGRLLLLLRGLAVQRGRQAAQGLRCTARRVRKGGSGSGLASACAHTYVHARTHDARTVVAGLAVR